VAETLIVGSWSIGAAFSFSPNFQQGVMAADRIFALLRRVPNVKNVSQPLYLHHNDVSDIIPYKITIKVGIQNILYDRI
jgi:hypothetical protein